MLKIIVIAVLSVCFVDAQQHQFQPQHQQQQPYSGYAPQHQNGYSGYSPSSGHSGYTTTTTPRPYFPPAQVHYVNIGQDLAGDYKFGYDTGKGPSGQSFREEVRLPDGTVMGAYGYLDEHGKQRIVKYTAGKEGFKVDSDTPAPKEGAAPQQQQPQASPTASPPTQQVSHSLPQAPPQYVPQQQLSPPPRPQQPQYQYQAPPTPPRYQQISLPQYAPLYRQQPQPAPQQYQPPPQASYQAPPQTSYHPPPQSYQPPPSYQAQSQYQPPAVQFPKPAPSPQYSEPPRQQRPHNSYPSNEDLLSAFPQLPGVQLMVINRRPRPANLPPQAYNPGYLPSLSQPSNTLLQSGSRNVPKRPEEEEYTGPVVINAALLNYDIGTGRRTN